MGFGIVHEIYANSHNRQMLIETLQRSGVYGAIILDNGHHGYGYVGGEIRDFSSEEVPYREMLNFDASRTEIKDGDRIIIIPIIGNYGLAAILYLTDVNPNIAEAAKNALRLYDEFRNVQERDPRFSAAFNKNYLRHFDPRDEPYGILMADLDHFKQINDKYGHKAGDEVLKNFVELINKVLPKGTFLVRYGGEEFTVVMPKASVKELYKLADRINRIMRNLTVQYEGKEIKVTVSVGGGVYSPKKSIQDAIGDADKKLYESKNGGRDRATINTTIK